MSSFGFSHPSGLVHWHRRGLYGLKRSRAWYAWFQSVALHIDFQSNTQDAALFIGCTPIVLVLLLVDVAE